MKNYLELRRRPLMDSSLEVRGNGGNESFVSSVGNLLPASVSTAAATYVCIVWISSARRFPRGGTQPVVIYKTSIIREEKLSMPFEMRSGKTGEGKAIKQGSNRI